MNRRLEFTITGPPVAWPRTGTRQDAEGKVHRFNPARYREWKKAAAGRMALERRGATFAGPVSVAVTIAADRVEVVFLELDPDRRRPLAVTGDLDNYAKAVLDAAQESGVIADDRQVAFLVATFEEGP